MHGETSVPSGHLSNSDILDICRREECREEHEGRDGDSPKVGSGYRSRRRGDQQWQLVAMETARRSEADTAHAGEETSNGSWLQQYTPVMETVAQRSKARIAHAG